MTLDAAAAIADLDQALAEDGQTIVLSRPGAGGPADLTCRGFARGYKPEEIVGALTQKDSLVILSPTNVTGAGWPEPAEGDRVKVAGAWLRVQAPGLIRMADTLVRIELQVRGS